MVTARCRQSDEQFLSKGKADVTLQVSHRYASLSLRREGFNLISDSMNYKATWTLPGASPDILYITLRRRALVSPAPGNLCWEAEEMPLGSPAGKMLVCQCFLAWGLSLLRSGQAYFGWEWASVKYNVLCWCSMAFGEASKRIYRTTAY